MDGLKVKVNVNDIIDMIEVEIDKDSGFCFGVVTAIESAERELGNTDTLYCLGDIVHNSLEVERLEHMGCIRSIMMAFQS